MSQVDSLSKTIHEQIINYILESPLNIDIIPDNIEREMYERIFHIVQDVITSDTFWQRCKKCLISIKNGCVSCCNRSRKED